MKERIYIVPAFRRMSETYTLNGRRSSSHGNYGATKHKQEDKVKILPENEVKTSYLNCYV